MKSDERKYYTSGYGHQCVTALLLFGYPPDYRDRAFGSSGVIRSVAWNKYCNDLREWWLSTQNPDTHIQCAYRFQKFFLAWCKDQKQRGKQNGII